VVVAGERVSARAAVEVRRRTAILRECGFEIVPKVLEVDPKRDRKGLLAKLREIEGDPSGTSESKTRKEQDAFRSYLLGKSKAEKCALCEQLFPPSMLIVAHIKKRAECTPSERKDPDVVMLACRFGCDDLFEQGYISVGSDGVIQCDHSMPATPAMAGLLNRLEGSRPSVRSDANKHYFDARTRSHRAA
jgi:hypothetical protein